MRAHVALEVEVGELIGLLELEKAGKLGIRVDLATILLVLKIVSANVSVNVAGYFSASHLGTNGLLQELGKLITNTSGLDKSRGSAVTRLALSLAGLLLGGL